MTTAPIAGRRTFRRPAAPASRGPARDQFRPSASHAIPPLRSVADFVGLPSTRRYVTVQGKFLIALGGAGLWLLLAMVASVAFLGSLASAVSWPVAVLMVAFVVYVPAVLTAFACLGIVLDDPPGLEIVHPTTPVTVVVTARDQSKAVVVCLAYLAAQDYDGPLSVLLVDNASTDNTISEACRAAKQLGIGLQVLVERRDGRVHSYNTGLACVDTPVFVTVDASTVLHPSAVRLLVARLMQLARRTPPRSPGTRSSGTSAPGRSPELEATDYALGGQRRAASARSLPGRARRRGRVQRVPHRRGPGRQRLAAGRRRGRRAHVAVPRAGLARVPRAARGRLHHRGGLGAVARSPPGARRGRPRRRHPRGRRPQPALPLQPVPHGDRRRRPAARPRLHRRAGCRRWCSCSSARPASSACICLFVLPLSLATTAIVRRNHNEVMDELGLAPNRSPASVLSSVLTFHPVQAPLSIWSYALELADAARHAPEPRRPASQGLRARPAGR